MNYQNKKQRIRNMAISWQQDISNNSYSYEEFILFQDMFKRLGRRFGLLKEFKENGIL